MEPVQHRFSYRMAIPLLYLDEVAEFCALHPLWSVERFNAVSFRRSDYLPGEGRALADCARDLVAERLGVRPSGPIAMLAHVRTWGWLFNPISLYYCFDANGTGTQALVAEVANTPWHERHNYVVAEPGHHTFDKELHVSPFFAMDMTYALDYTDPGERLSVRLRSLSHGEVVFDASMNLRRREASRRTLGEIIFSYPFMTARVSAGIYRQAARLRRAGVPFVAHPKHNRVMRTSATAPSDKKCGNEMRDGG